MATVASHTRSRGAIGGTANDKPIPPPSIELLFHPESDVEYQHFEGSAQHPFDYGATSFSRVNAWWLSDAALLSYWDADTAANIWARADLQFEVVVVDGAQCHIGWNDAFVLVAYRGTEPDEAQDLFDIARFGLVDWKFGGGSVHSGFLEAHSRIWGKVEQTLRRLNPTRRTIWFTGHSLGGALATLSMDRFATAAGVYTFGSPRVGNPRFSSFFNRRHRGRCFRYVNNRDVITHLPPALSPAGLYKHVDDSRVINADGSIASRWSLDLSTLALPWTGHGTGQAIAAAHRTLLLPGWLVDHTPRRYAVHVWNDYARNGA
jgi:hypothetical protein